MSQTRYPFDPHLGTEEIVLQQTPKTGALYFTTDTRKIYLDIDANRQKIPMGGNIGLFYGKMKPAVVVDDQKEFEFKMEDIVGNEDLSKLLIPNVNDLILNNDGCFYKILSVIGEGFETILNTEKLTIAGTGGGGSGDLPGGGDNTLTSFTVGAFNVSNRALLEGGECFVQFIVKSTNDIGEYITGEVGSYELIIGNKPITTGPVVGIPFGEASDDLNKFEEQYINTINIASFLPLGTTTPVLKIYDSEGRQKVSRYLSSITKSTMQLTWDYDNKTLNEWLTGSKESMTLKWSVSGHNLEKTTYITIDSNNYPIEIGKGTKTDFTYELKFEDNNMMHGAHTVKMWTEAKVGNQVVSTDPIYKNIIVAKDSDPTTIISICLFDKELAQYNTVAIPVYIYNRNNTAGTAIVNLVENGELKDQWENVPNLGQDIEKSTWNYTPVLTGDAIMLTVQSGGQEETVLVSVKAIDININEKQDYAFKFKASDFSSNTNVKNWKIGNDVGLIFSDKFDWINGGLKSEDDSEGGKRQFMAVRAGSTMTINYPMWKQNAQAFGKHFKFIFKAANCRDYDAQILASKVDKKVIDIDKTVEYFWLSEPVVSLTFAKTIVLKNGQIEMQDVNTKTLDINDKTSRQEFNGVYVEFEDGIYQCAFIQTDPENNPDEVYNAWYKVSVKDSFNGILCQAQSATIRTNNEVLETQYCEDTYIELEVEVTQANNKRYIKFWIDGVPAGYTEYSTNDRFILENEKIVIGSPDCDVYVYLAKLYETELTIDEHMDNFFADAPNAEEMVRRYRRNDIMSEEREGEIDMFKLAAANPDCLVHHYDVPHMPTTKKDETYPCSYTQYQGSDQAKYYADGVMIKVQGTSSEKYVVAAANLDTDFNYTDNNNVPSGIIDGKTQQVLPDGWSMDDGTAIPVNFACTKVNVASCENINNRVNQEWYNMFQPYKSVLRCKNPRARDTMQFTNGVLFVTDHNTKIDDSKGITNNVFADTIMNGKSYVSDPYPKMYSMGQMGNSKENLHVFHDTENPLECCVEVADNQMPQQWMVNDNYNKADIGEAEKYFEFRYPKKAKNASQAMIDGWNRFVSWMAHSNPQPRYNKFENILTEKQFKDISINKKTFTKIDVYVMNDEKTAYSLIDNFDPSISTYYTLTDHIYGYTDLALESECTFGSKTFEGFIAKDQINAATGEPWQKNYTPMIKGCTVDTYAGTYTHDTYEYRMAKMLQECEDYLIMDSVLYHYLFIERHCMIDNVAKNTFWSSEDCIHWNLIKDYDNDTADGNDNQGKFTRTYGMEPTDRLNANAFVFNAHQSVWFNFIHGLDVAREYMYNKLESAKVTYNNKQINVWDADAYLAYCEEQQKKIPERCWIEDYYRKYFRPNEVYNDPMFNSMLEGGQKKYQRKQYETYEHMYMGSKYNGINLNNDYLVFRPTGSNLKDIKIPVEIYSDCYIYSATGGQIAKTRAKRNSVSYLTCPVNELGNATMYIYPGSNFTKLGSLDASGQLGAFAPDQMSFAGAKKLREIIYATEGMGTNNYGLKNGISFKGNTLLEKVYLSNLVYYEDSLDMSECTSLLELNVKNSGFTDISIAKGAPTVSLALGSPTSLTLSNLTELNTLDISNYSKLKSLTLHNIDTKHMNFSKNIITEALKHVDTTNETSCVEYHITDARWSIDNIDEMNNETNITILDQMLNSSYARPAMSEDKINRLPYSAALTGNLKITKAAYDGNEPLKIYDKYITDTAFANIDMSFESDNAKLCDVIIYDGDSLVFWQRKTTVGTELNSDFLEEGPNGKFDSSALYKSPTAEFEYIFLNQWTVKNKDGDFITELEGTSPINITVDQDLHIYPKFDEWCRKYEISIKMKHPNPKYNGEIIDLVETKEYEYGTSLNNIIPNDLIPYADADGLKPLQVYDFKGYSLVEGSSIPVSNNYIVSGKATLWAIFQLEENVRNIIHPEWFKFTPAKYTADTDEQYYETPGLAIEPKDNIILKGKITIPATAIYEGIERPVIVIKNFGGSQNIESKHQITHVFMEDNNKINKLYHIDRYAFARSSNLIHFDFDKCAVRVFDEYCFQHCPNLANTSFGNTAIQVRTQAFNQSMTSDMPVVIQIPSSIQTIQKLGFGVMGYASGSQLDIGNENNLSKLQFNTSSNVEPFYQNPGNKFKTINFYSVHYDVGDELAINNLSDAIMTNGTISIM